MRQIALLLLLLAASCAAPVLKPPPAEHRAFILGPGDEIKVTVFGDQKLSGDYKVDGMGIVRFPLVGEVAAAKKTIPQFQSDLSAGLAAGYLKDAKLTVELATARPVYVLGEVQHAGEFPYDESMTVLQAVAKAGGFTYRANRSRVFILHRGEDQETKYALTPSTPLEPGDTIRIGERYF